MGKENKYKILTTLKTLLKETIELQGLDIAIQSSKVLHTIHSEHELSKYFDKKVEEYLQLKNSNCEQYYTEEQKEYERFANLALKCDEKISLCKYFSGEKIFTKAIDFEYKAVMMHLYAKLPTEIFEQIQTKCIYDGIFKFYDYIAYNVARIFDEQPFKTENLNYISVRTVKQPQPLLPNIKLLYDFYFLEHKEKQDITSDNIYLNEWIYLKIAIIQVLNSVIKYLNSLKTRNDSPTNLKPADVEFLKLAINKQVYMDDTITTQEVLIEKMNPTISDVSNETKKLRNVCNYYKYIIPKELEQGSTLTKFLYIAKQLQETFT